jgi:phosphopantothenoylcysteine decarboxylase/phosphopantothenate--cysteine ligase
MTQPRVLLIVSGGIAAYKALELVRLLKRQGVSVRAVMTKSAAEFVTPLSMGVMTEDQVYGDMFDLKEEREIGHIQLSRQADLVVICPATANILAKMAAGIADDLATTILLATDKPVLAVPAMNVRMWNHPATQRNLAQLRADGVHIMNPDEGAMACPNRRLLPNRFAACWLCPSIRSWRQAVHRPRCQARRRLPRNPILRMSNTVRCLANAFL